MTTRNSARSTAGSSTHQSGGADARRRSVLAVDYGTLQSILEGIATSPSVVSRVARETVREYRVLWLVFAVQLTVSWLLCYKAGRPVLVGLSDAVQTIDGAVVLFGAMALAVALVRRRPAGSPVIVGYRVAWRELRSRVATSAWIASVLMFAIVLPLSLALFSAAKRAIPGVEPFAWDAVLERTSVTIHGGRHAWEWLQPIVGHPLVTVLLDRYYHIGWSLIALGTLGLVVVAPRSSLRRRFLTAWLSLTFVCGTVSALVFSSVGPPYYARVSDRPDPYAPLRLYLRTVNEKTPLLSVGGRRALWTAYQSHTDKFGFGISAMPSMHIAVTTLVACLAWAVAPRLGLLAVGGVILMLVGSVSLLWHYALDGYVGCLIAVLIWWATGVVERRPFATANPEDPSDASSRPRIPARISTALTTLRGH